MLIYDFIIALLRRRAASEASEWLFLSHHVLIYGYQKTTTPVVFDAFPSFAGGELSFVTNQYELFNKVSIPELN